MSALRSVVCLLVFLVLPCGAAVCREDGERLVLSASAWELQLDRAGGAFRSLRDRTSPVGLVEHEGSDLWVMERRGQTPLESSGLTFDYRWNPEQQQLLLRFLGEAAEVELDCRAEDAGPMWVGRVRMKQGTMLGWTCLLYTSPSPRDS